MPTTRGKRPEEVEREPAARPFAARERAEAVTVINSCPFWARGSLKSLYTGVWFGPFTIAAFIVRLLCSLRSQEHSHDARIMWLRLIGINGNRSHCQLPSGGTVLKRAREECRLQRRRQRRA